MRASAKFERVHVQRWGLVREEGAVTRGQDRCEARKSMRSRAPNEWGMHLPAAQLYDEYALVFPTWLDSASSMPRRVRALMTLERLRKDLSNEQEQKQRPRLTVYPGWPEGLVWAD